MFLRGWGFVTRGNVSREGSQHIKMLTSPQTTDLHGFLLEHGVATMQFYPRKLAKGVSPRFATHQASNRIRPQQMR